MTKKLGMVIYPEAQSLDIIGPWEVFAIHNKIAKTPLEMFLIAEKPGPVNLDNQIQLAAHCDFNTAPQLDYLIVPGGKGRNNAMGNNNLLNFLQKQAHSADYIISICTGMFLLYQAGLLTQQTVTSYWLALPELRTLPEIKIIEQRIAKNKKIWCSAGVTSGIDLALEFISDLFGKSEAGQTQLLLEYFPEHKVYASKSDVAQLPPYQGNKISCNELPAYLAKIMQQE